MGIEDALVLCTLLGKTSSMVEQGSGHDTASMLAAAFKVYDGLRRERSQFVVESSRVIGETLMGHNPRVGRDSSKILHELNWRYEKGMLVDGKEMVETSLRELEAALELKQ
jgi:salicylate hydroxylase